MALRLAVIVMTLTICGCISSDKEQKPPPQAKIELRLGDEFGQALKTMSDMGLKPHEEATAVANITGAKCKHLQVGVWEDDALFVTACLVEQVNGEGEKEKYVIDDCYWYNDWKSDSEQPVAKRQRKLVHLKSIDLSRLIEERGFGDILSSNPTARDTKNPFGD